MDVDGFQRAESGDAEERDGERAYIAAPSVRCYQAPLIIPLYIRASYSSTLMCDRKRDELEAAEGF